MPGEMLGPAWDVLDHVSELAVRHDRLHLVHRATVAAGDRLAQRERFAHEADVRPALAAVLLVRFGFGSTARAVHRTPHSNRIPKASPARPLRSSPKVPVAAAIANNGQNARCDGSLGKS